MAFESAEGTIRVTEWGGMTIDLGSFRKEFDASPHFKGLPDDRCQCPQWGYVLQGQLHFMFADHEEVYHAGDVYYAAPGHTPVMGADTEYVQFSPTELFEQITEAIMRNLTAM